MDKVIRVIIAVLVVVLYFTKIISGLWAIILISIAGIFLATSFFSFCPIYSIFGISSIKKSQKA